jgi:GNAT superfamily N-acetyltransferase
MEMRIISVCDWGGVEHLWRQWESFRADDPVPVKLPEDSLLISAECLFGNLKFTLPPDRPVPRTFFWGATSELGSIEIRGTLSIFPRYIQGMSIGGIGKMAVHPLYRRNGIASDLMRVALLYMQRVGFDISLLWASVLKFYESFGYIPLTNRGKETNMMFRPIRGLPGGTWSKQDILDLPKVIGTF